jgi:hypothetical protein
MDGIGDHHVKQKVKLRKTITMFSLICAFLRERESRKREGGEWERKENRPRGLLEERKWMLEKNKGGNGDRHDQNMLHACMKL